MMRFIDCALANTANHLEETIIDYSYDIHTPPPKKEIALAVFLLVTGTLAIATGIFMAIFRFRGDHAHGIALASLGTVLFIPGFYYTRLAYYAYMGYKGYYFYNIPAV